MKGEEDDVEKEKLRAQVEDLQKQLEEKKDEIRVSTLCTYLCIHAYDFDTMSE